MDYEKFLEADLSRYQKLEPAFFRQNSTEVGSLLVGCLLITRKDGIITGGRIVETEAYPAFDCASHAYGPTGRTFRTEVQFNEGGIIYVYLIMGLHVMTSIVTGEKGVADVVFIRSLEPLIGLETMQKRRNYCGSDPRRLTAGPGRLSEALGIGLTDQGRSLFAADENIVVLKDIFFVGKVERGKRINLGTGKASPSEAKDSIGQPWRFFLKDSPFLS